MFDLRYYESEILLERREYAQAVNALREAIASRVGYVIRRWEDICLYINNIGYAYRCLGQYDSAEEYYLLSYTVRKKLCELHSGLYGKMYPVGCQKLSAFYEATGNSEKAKQYAEEAAVLPPPIEGMSDWEEEVVYDELFYRTLEQIFGEDHECVLSELISLAYTRKRCRRKMGQEKDFDPTLGLTKPIVFEDGIEIPPLMRKILSGLTYAEQLPFFRLRMEWDASREVTLDRTTFLSIPEEKDVDSVIVCDGVVVGVNVTLRDVYFSFTVGSSAEYFHRPSGRIHQLESRYGGEYYHIYSNARYTFTCVLN